MAKKVKIEISPNKLGLNGSDKSALPAYLMQIQNINNQVNNLNKQKKVVQETYSGLITRVETKLPRDERLVVQTAMGELTVDIADSQSTSYAKVIKDLIPLVASKYGVDISKDVETLKDEHTSEYARWSIKDRPKS